MAFTPKTWQVKKLSAEPGTTLFYVSPDLVVVQKSAGDGGVPSTSSPQNSVCKCTKMEYECEPSSGWNRDDLQGSVHRVGMHGGSLRKRTLGEGVRSLGCPQRSSVVSH